MRGKNKGQSTLFASYVSKGMAMPYCCRFAQVHFSVKLLLCARKLRKIMKWFSSSQFKTISLEKHVYVMHTLSKISEKRQHRQNGKRVSTLCFVHTDIILSFAVALYCFATDAISHVYCIFLSLN